MKKNVKSSRIDHSMTRANERYNVELTDVDIRKIANLIKRQKSELIIKESLSKAHHKVEYNGIFYYVVYSKVNKTIVTVLTEEQAKYKCEKLRQKARFRKERKIFKKINILQYRLNQHKPNFNLEIGFFILSLFFFR